MAGDAATFDAVALHNGHGDLRFEKQDSSWTFSDLAEGESADTEKIEAFLSAVAKLRMREPVGPDELPEFGLSRGSPEDASDQLRIDWTIVAEDKSVSGGYAVGAAVDGDRYVKAVDQLFVVRVAESAVQRLLDAKRSEFLK